MQRQPDTTSAAARTDGSGSSSSGSSSVRSKRSGTGPRAWTPRASHVRESVLAYFAPGTEALRLLVSVLRPGGPTSIRTVLWFVTNYAAHHRVAYDLKCAAAPAVAVATAAAAAAAAAPATNVDTDAANTDAVSAMDGAAATTTAPSRTPRLPLQPSGSARASIPLGHGGLRPPFVVSTQYQNARDAIGDKLLFDPNCRVSYNLEIADGQGSSLATSVGQLNFFKWAIQKQVLQYVIEHRAAIALDQTAREDRDGGDGSSSSSSRRRRAREQGPEQAAAGAGGAPRKRRRREPGAMCAAHLPAALLLAR